MHLLASLLCLFFWRAMANTQYSKEKKFLSLALSSVFH